MREILFRAKRIDNGEWVEGYVFSTLDHTYIAYAGQFDDDLFFGSSNIFVKVDPETICQYTGLKDWNGKMIWENDIIDTPYQRFAVTYSDGIWGDKDGVPMRESIFGEGGTVVGNIFDNPEVLKGE